MARETVVVPDIGSDTGEVVEVLVSPGETIAVDQGLVVLESDKASMEIPSSAAGTLVELLVKEGDELSEGASVAVIDTGSEGDADGEDQAPESAGEDQAGAEESSADDAGSEARVTDTQGAADDTAVADVESAADDTDASGQRTVNVPDIGTDEGVDVVEVAVQVGDSVSENDTLIVLESDKASMEVPSPAAGEVEKLLVKEGQQVREGDEILVLKTAGGSSERAGGDETPPPQTPADADTAETPPTPDSKAPSRAPASPKSSKEEPPESDAASSTAGVYAGPAVRRLAREFGVPLLDVRGSGPRGRILKEDLHQFVQQSLSRAPSAAGTTGIPEVPVVDFAEFGPVDVVERSKIAKVTAANMQRSWLNVPHVTQFDDADITALEAFRKSLADEAGKRGTRLTPIPFLLKACAVALLRHEKINASLSDGGNSLTYKRYVHIGMAVDTPAGLMVPVLRDVDRKSLWDLAEEVIDLADRARERKLKPAEMQGAGFTISSLGAIGGRGFTPIVNTPEVAILGVGKSSMQPHWNGSDFEPRLMLPLSLSYDHRVVNGGDAGRFLTELGGLLGDIRRMLL